MKVELRRITYNARLSQETPAFAADIWIDDKRRGTVQNDGHGGPHMIEPRQLQAELDAHARTLPPIPASHGLPEMPMDGELLLGRLLDDHLAERDLKRALRTKYLFVATNGKLYSCKKVGAPPKDAAKVLNDLPLADALALYTAGGQ